MAVNNCIKYLLFFFNLLFWISGCIILGVSIYLKVNKNDNQLTSETIPGVDLMIAIGVIIMVLGFLGCCGAIKENRCMLLLFFISLLIIFILLLAAGIVGAVNENTVKDWVKKQLEEKFTPLSDKSDSVKEDLVKLQEEMKCCGLIAKEDWGSTLPPSCKCNATETACQNGVYSTSCSDRIVQYMEQNLEVVLGIAFAIAILLIFGMVMAMVLYCQIGRKDAATTA